MSADAIVYIVDDDEAIRKSLMFLLKSSGHEGYPCASAKEFLDAYDRKRPGCLVLDVRMPGMTGLELQEMLATTGIDIPTFRQSAVVGPYPGSVGAGPSTLDGARTGG
jgi:two-component system response regulator FixJ